MLTVFTDGSCVGGNPGMAAAAYVVARGSLVLEGAGEPLGRGTNNRAELIAAINGMRAAARLAEPGEQVLLASDSTYVVHGIGKAAANAARGIANHDLWVELADAVAKVCVDHNLEARWVRGHSDTPGNRLCDALVRAAARAQRRYETVKEVQNDET